MARVGVVVPVRNARPDDLRRCLGSVSRAIARASDVPVAVVVSDDSSEASLAVEYLRLALAHGTGYVRSAVWGGVGGGRNLGLAHIRSSVTHVIFVDADDEIDEACLASLAGAAAADSIATALCCITGWGLPYTPPKAVLLRLLQAHHGLRSSPLLYMNVIGQPALLPVEALDAVGGYVERRYSGEHVDLWGRLLLGGVIRRISLVPKVLYRYHSTPQGNYRRDARRHRIGVAWALGELARRYFNEPSEYRWMAAGRPLPSLYAPAGPNDTVNLPAWAALDGNRWSLQMPATGSSPDSAQRDYPLPHMACSSHGA